MASGRGGVCLLLGFLFLGSPALAGTAGAPVVRIAGDELVIRASFPAPSFVDTGDGVVPLVADWPSLADAPGRPRLPVATFHVVLPPDAEPGLARAVGRPRELPGSFAVAWGQPPERLSRPEGRRVDRDLSVYGVDGLYPRLPARVTGIGFFRGYRVVTLAVHPLQLRPESGRLLFWSDVELRVPLARARETRPAPVPRGLPGDVAALARFTVNPEAAYLAGAPEESRSADIPYLILTPEELRPAFERLLPLRASQGMPGEIRTIESVLAEEPGRDAAEKVRNAILRAFRDQGTTFVLLGGDDARDDGTPLVPARFCAPYDNMASDWYFGALDGDFDADGDGIFCEEGEVDYFAEVHVGRATVDTLAEANRWIDKVETFEAGLPEARRLDLVFMGEKLDNSTYSDDHMERTAAIVPPEYAIEKLYARPELFSAASVIASLDRGPHLTNHLGHASWDYTMGIGIGDVESLVNASPFVSYSQGCYAGAFDHGVSGATEAISEHFLTASHAAVADVMNDRYGWYYVGWDQGLSQDLAHQFHDALFNEGLTTLGEANDDARADNAGTAQTDGTMRYCFLETNLHGDPATRIATRRAALRVASVRIDDADPRYANANGDADPGETVRLWITLRNDGDATAGQVSARASSSAPGALVHDDWTRFPDLAPGTAAENLPHPVTVTLGGDCGTEAAFRLEIRHDDGLVDVDVFSLPAGRRTEVPIHATDCETDAGWTAGGDATQGRFVRQDPYLVTDGWVGLVQPDDDCTEGSGGRAWVTGNPAPGPNFDPRTGDLKKGTAWILSPAFDGTGEGRLLLRFGRFFHRTAVGFGNTGLYLARVSTDDGGSWIDLERLEGTVPRWTMRTLDVTAALGAASPTPTMRVRFEATERVRYMQEGEPLVELLVDDVSLFRRVSSCGAFAASETLPPGAVGGTLALDRAGEDVALEWIAPAEDAMHGPPLFFPVYRSTTPTGGFSPIAEPTRPAWRDVGGAGPWAGSLFYLVAARNAAGASGEDPSP